MPQLCGVLPHQAFLWIFLRPVLVRITGLNNFATDSGCAGFVPEYGFLQASSLKGTYKNSKVLYGLRV